MITTAGEGVNNRFLYKFGGERCLFGDGAETSMESRQNAKNEDDHQITGGGLCWRWVIDQRLRQCANDVVFVA